MAKPSRRSHKYKTRLKTCTEVRDLNIAFPSTVLLFASGGHVPPKRRGAGPKEGEGKEAGREYRRRGHLCEAQRANAKRSL